MGAYEFGRLVDRAITSRGISQARVAILVGELPDGRVLNDTQVRRIREGGRRLDHTLVGRLIEVLDLDWAEAWESSGLLPTHVTAEDLRQLEQMRQRPLEPTLARVGGSDTPTAFSLRTTRSHPHQEGPTMATLIVLADRRARHAETRRVA